VIRGPRHSRTAQGADRRDENAQHLAGRVVLRPHDVEDPLRGEPGQIEVERLAGVQVVLREDVSGGRGAAHRVHARQLQDVEAVGVRRQEMPALVMDDTNPPVPHPTPEVVTVVATQDLEGGPVDLDPRELSGVESQSGQDVEAPTHADREDTRLHHRRGLVGGSVDRLLDAREAAGVAVVGHRVGERVVVLGQHALEALQEIQVRADQGRPGKALGVGRGSAHDFDARDRVPEGLLQDEPLPGTWVCPRSERSGYLIAKTRSEKPAASNTAAALAAKAAALPPRLASGMKSPPASSTKLAASALRSTPRTPMAGMTAMAPAADPRRSKK
jgi:hypothetical protein